MTSLNLCDALELDTVVLVFGDSFLLREVSATLAEEGRLLPVGRPAVGRHTVVAHCLFTAPFFRARVDLMVTPYVFVQPLLIVEILAAVRTEINF